MNTKQFNKLKKEIESQKQELELTKMQLDLQNEKNKLEMEIKQLKNAGKFSIGSTLKNIGIGAAKGAGMMFQGIGKIADNVARNVDREEKHKAEIKALSTEKSINQDKVTKSDSKEYIG